MTTAEEHGDGKIPIRITKAPYCREYAGRGVDATLLEIDMQYRVSTAFDWYAKPIARWLIWDFSEVILGFYRARSEQAVEGDAGLSSPQG